MKKVHKAFIPRFLSKLNQYLLIQSPLLWASKLIYLIFFTAIVLLFTLSFSLFSPIQLDNLIQPDYLYYVIAAINALLFIIWCYSQLVLKYRVFHGITDRLHDARVAAIFIFATVLCFSAFYLPSYMYHSRMVNTFIDPKFQDSFGYVLDSSRVKEIEYRETGSNLKIVEASLLNSDYKLQSENLVNFFPYFKYQGYPHVLTPGIYKSDTLSKIKNKLRQIASIRLHWKYDVVFYKNDEFTGDSLVINRNYLNFLISDEWTSLKVRYNPNANLRTATLFKDCDYDYFSAQIYTDFSFDSERRALKIYPDTISEERLYKGGFSDDLSAIDLPIGYEMWLYSQDQLFGDNIFIDNSTPCLVDNSFNDKTKSLLLRPSFNELRILKREENKVDSVLTTIYGKNLELRNNIGVSEKGDTVKIATFLLFDTLARRNIAISNTEIGPYLLYKEINNSVKGIQDEDARYMEFYYRASAIESLMKENIFNSMPVFLAMFLLLLYGSYFLVISSNAINFFGLRRFLISASSFIFVLVVAFLVLDSIMRGVDTEFSEKIFYLFSIPGLLLILSILIRKFSKKTVEIYFALWYGFGAPVGLIFFILELADLNREVFSKQLGIMVIVSVFTLLFLFFIYHVPKQFYRMYCHPAQ